MNKQLLTLALTGILVFSSAALAFALPGGPDGHNSPEGLGGEGKIVRMIMHLDLTTEQKQRVASIIKKQRETGKATIEAFRDAMHGLRDASTTDTYNEDAVLKAYAEVSKTGEQMALMRAKIYADVMAVLTSQQRETLAKERQEMFDHGKERFKKHMNLLDEWIDKYTTSK